MADESQSVLFPFSSRYVPDMASYDEVRELIGRMSGAQPRVPRFFRTLTIFCYCFTAMANRTKYNYARSRAMCELSTGQYDLLAVVGRKTDDQEGPYFAIGRLPRMLAKLAQWGFIVSVAQSNNFGSGYLITESGRAKLAFSKFGASFEVKSAHCQGTHPKT